MALWHDLYTAEDDDDGTPEMSREARLLRKRGVDIIRCYRKGDYTYLVVSSILDSSLTCMAVQHYLQARWDCKYREVHPAYGPFKGGFEFVFVEG